MHTPLTKQVCFNAVYEFANSFPLHVPALRMEIKVFIFYFWKAELCQQALRSVATKNVVMYYSTHLLKIFLKGVLDRFLVPLVIHHIHHILLAIRVDLLL